jgi:hypothetical protein
MATAGAAGSAQARLKGEFMRRFLMMIGLGFGLAIGLGLVYTLMTNEPARLFIIAIFMFILGALIVGVCIIIANLLMVRAFTGRKEQTTIHYKPPAMSLAPRADVLPPWSASAVPPGLAAPPTAWPGFGPSQVGAGPPFPHAIEPRSEDRLDDDEYVA